MLYANELKVTVPTQPMEQEELWVITNRFVQYSLGVLSADDYNFRVLAAPVKRLIEGTKCQIPAETLQSLKEIHKNDGQNVVST